MKIQVKLLDRYIWQQLIFLFIGSVVLLAALGVALGTVSDLTHKISEYNFPLSIAVQIFFLKIPEYTTYALPIALLLTSLIVYGRLNLNSELVAFFSSGINVYSIVKPAVLFSIVITGMTFLLNEFIVPTANYEVARLENIFLPKTKSYIQKKDVFYPEYKTFGKNNSKLLRLYYAKYYNENNFREVTIVDWKLSHIQKIIVARTATWNRETKTWQFFDGRIETFEEINNLPISRKSPLKRREAREKNSREQNRSSLGKVEFFKQKSLLLPSTFFEIANREKDPEKMSLREAKKYLALIIKSQNQPKIRLFRVRIQQKLAFPFICIVFAIIGSSIGMNFDRINRGKGFGVCVGIVFSYYLLGFMIGSCGIVGLVSPVVAGWLPNFLGWGIGGWLLYDNNY